MHCDCLLELVPRVMKERSACRLLLEEVSYLGDMLDPKKHPSLYDDFQGGKPKHHKGNASQNPHSQDSQRGKTPEEAEAVEEESAAWPEPAEQPDDPYQETGDGGHEGEQKPNAGADQGW